MNELVLMMARTEKAKKLGLGSAIRHLYEAETDQLKKDPEWRRRKREFWENVESDLSMGGEESPVIWVGEPRLRGNRCLQRVMPEETRIAYFEAIVYGQGS